MKVYDALSKAKKTFTPLKPGHIGMYVCGPTVYDVGHLGHARAAVSFDIIRRYFLYKGFKVTFVSNITDVDDKMIQRARKEGITEAELAQRIIPEYAKDYGALKVLPPDHQPRCTEYIDHMNRFIEKLLDLGAAYETSDGVYFHVAAYKKYGQLSGQRLSEMRAGARIEVDEKKERPEDFALWKKAKEGEPTWIGPRGMAGRPGWHTECCAMSMHLLGETFDIHGGGIDLMFPHHEDERAQSELVTGKTFARYWMHNGHVQVQKEKMSKSLGNFFTIKEILAKYNRMVVRYFLLATHYRMPIDFTHELLEQAKHSLARLQDCVRAVVRKATGADDGDPNIFGTKSIINRGEKAFLGAMDDDFEISRALAAIFDLVDEVNRRLPHMGSAEALLYKEFFEKIDSVLAVLISAPEDVSDEIQALIEERNQARKNKNFHRSDAIRKQLESQGIILEDTPHGTVWKKAL